MNTTVKGWIAAGSSATLLVGGLVLGAPAAVAAPGDAPCLQASGQFTTALAAAGITTVSVGQLELAAGAVVVAEVQYFALTDAAAGELQVQVETAWLELEAAEAAEDPEAIAPGPVATTPAPAPATPSAPVAPVVAAPEQEAPAGMNPGLNMQTAATAEHEHPGAALVAGLLGAGIAAPAAVAVRRHRLQRHRP